MFRGRLRRLVSRFQPKLGPQVRWGEQLSLAERLDLNAPGVACNPFPHYEALRQSGPVHFLPLNGCWLVIGFDEVAAALAQPHVFSSTAPENVGVDSVLLGADPPDHTKIRSLVSRCFSIQALESQREFAAAAAEGILQPLITGGPFDVLRQFGAPLSDAVAAHLIGFDDHTLAEIQTLERNVTDLGARLQALDSIIGGAAQRTRLHAELSQIESSGISEKEIRSVIRFLWIAATTTTRRAIASSVLMLLQYPEVRARLESEPNHLPGFIEETIRLHPPEYSILRSTKSDVMLAGKEIPAGATVKLCLAAANRDPARFDQPEVLIPERTPNRQLSFGGGIHRCVGAALARMEMATALRTLMRVAPQFRSLQPVDELEYSGFVNDSEQLIIDNGRRKQR